MKLSKTHYITIVLLLVVTAALIIWDVVVITNDVKGDTISAIVFETSQRVTWLPFMFGALMAHLFWPRYKSGKIESAAIGFVYLLLVSGLFVLIDIANVLYFRIPLYSPIPILTGFICGHFLWPNRGKDGQ